MPIQAYQSVRGILLLLGFVRWETRTNTKGIIEQDKACSALFKDYPVLSCLLLHTTIKKKVTIICIYPLPNALYQVRCIGWVESLEQPLDKMLFHKHIQADLFVWTPLFVL